MSTETSETLEPEWSTRGHRALDSGRRVSPQVVLGTPFGRREDVRLFGGPGWSKTSPPALELLSEFPDPVCSYPATRHDVRGLQRICGRHYSGHSEEKFGLPRSRRDAAWLRSCTPVRSSGLGVQNPSSPTWRLLSPRHSRKFPAPFYLRANPHQPHSPTRPLIHSITASHAIRSRL